MANTFSLNMLRYDMVIYLLILWAQLFIGVLINGFIMVVNAVGFIRKRQISPLDLLISCLATSRTCMQIFSFIPCVVLLSFTKQPVLQELNTTVAFINIWALWLATWLSVFYCAKIATIPHPLFSRLKMKISKLVPWLIMGSTMYAALGIGLPQKYVWDISEKYWGIFLFSNETVTKRTDIASLFFLMVHLIVPSIIFLIAVLLLILSLGKHAWKMRTTAMGTQNTCFSAPLRAMLPILSFLFLYFSYYGSAMVFYTQDLQNGRFFILFWILVGGSYPSMHSVFLILGNAKLKAIAKKFLHCDQRGQ